MKKIPRLILLGTVTVAAVVLCVGIVQALFLSPRSEVTVPSIIPVVAQSNPTQIQTEVPVQQTQTAAVADVPVHISIPALKVDTDIQQVGLTATDRMAVPTNFTSVGWYKYGTIPGQEGSAVIAGHVNNGLLFPAVFANLDKLQVGDDIYITMADTTTVHFVMTGSQSYNKDAPTADIFNGQGKLLRLITCTGEWLPLQRTHDQRLVVTAVLQT